MKKQESVKKKKIGHFNGEIEISGRTKLELKLKYMISEIK